MSPAKRERCVTCGTRTERKDPKDGAFRCRRCAGVLRAFEPIRGVNFDGALCAQVDPDLWFPEVGQDGKAAKKVCARCPVRQACHDYATEAIEPYGIWGGKTSRELRANRKTPPPPSEQGSTA